MREVRCLAAHHRAVLVAEPRRNRPDAAIANRSPVDRAPRPDPHRRAGEEQLAGVCQFRRRNIPLGAREPGASRQRQHGVARDAEQHLVRRGGRQCAVGVHEEDVGRRRLGDEAALVEQHDVVESGAPSLPLGHHRRRVVGRHLGVGRDQILAPPAAVALDAQGHLAAAAKLAGVVGDDVRLAVVGGDVHRHARVLRHQLHFNGGDERADLHGGGAGIAPHGGRAGVHEFLRSVAERQPHDPTGAQQALDVVVQPKHGHPPRCSVNAQVVEGQRAALQALGQDVYGGVPPSDELAIAPNRSLGHGRRGCHGRCATTGEGELCEFRRAGATRAQPLQPASNPPSNPLHFRSDAV